MTCDLETPIYTRNAHTLLRSYKTLSLFHCLFQSMNPPSHPPPSPQWRPPAPLVDTAASMAYEMCWRGEHISALHKLRTFLWVTILITT